MAGIAISSGRAGISAGGYQSMTTEVSTRPDVMSQGLTDHVVEVVAKLVFADTHVGNGQHS